MSYALPNQIVPDLFQERLHVGDDLCALDHAELAPKLLDDALAPPMNGRDGGELQLASAIRNRCVASASPVCRTSGPRAASARRHASQRRGPDACDAESAHAARVSRPR